MPAPQHLIGKPSRPPCHVSAPQGLWNTQPCKSCPGPPRCSTRVAVKTAVAADEANLRGERVKLAAVEERLLEVLSGGAPLSQVPDTVRGDGVRAVCVCV